MRRQGGSIIKRGKKYSVVFRMPNGKQKWVSGFPNKAIARTTLNEMLTEVTRGSFIEPRNTTFAEFAEDYIASRLSIRGSTASAYLSIIRCHLMPFFGEMKLQDIRLEVVQQFATNLAGKVSTKTLRNTVTLLKVMMASQRGSSAMKQGFIRYNPVQGVELPPVVVPRITPPTAEQVWKLIDTAAELRSRAHGIIYVAAFTGLRRGEILALTVADVDWFQQEIVVSKAVSKTLATDGVHKWQWLVGEPKSKRSHRRVGVSDRVIQVLSGLKQSVQNSPGFLFPGGNSGFIDPDYFDEFIFKPVKQAAGLSELRFHDLRHFFASMLIAQGESPKYVSDQLGHSSIQITFDTYGHLFPQAKAEAAKKLENRMLAEREKPTVSKLLAKVALEEADEGRPKFVN